MFDHLVWRMMRGVLYFYIVLLCLGLSTGSQAASDNQPLPKASQNNNVVAFGEARLDTGLEPNRYLPGSSQPAQIVEAYHVEVMLARQVRFTGCLFEETLNGFGRAVTLLPLSGIELTTPWDKSGASLLMINAREGHEEIARPLVEKGAAV